MDKIIVEEEPWTRLGWTVASGVRDTFDSKSIPIDFMHDVQNSVAIVQDKIDKGSGTEIGQITGMGQSQIASNVSGEKPNS